MTNSANETERRDEYLKKQQMLEKAYRLAHIGTWEYDMFTGKLYWSDITKEVHGFGSDYEPDVESTILLFKEGVDRDTFAKAVEDAINEAKPFDLELKIISGKGDERWIRATCEPEYRDGVCVRMYGISQNVTERRAAQEKLKQNEQQILESLREKETLLAEIHHRVKNNLAVVTGFLQLQAIREEDLEVVSRLDNSIARIKAMSVIHEQLYQSDCFSRVDFAENIRRLVRSILESWQPAADISTRFRCEPVQLTINQAIPCSLIVNELLTNTLKHAFPGRKKGRIEIDLTQSGSELVTLVIRDDGAGLTKTCPEHSKHGSLGLTLIKVLSKQLGADYQFESGSPGTRFTIAFRRRDPASLPI